MLSFAPLSGADRCGWQPKGARLAWAGVFVVLVGPVPCSEPTVLMSVPGSAIVGGAFTGRFWMDEPDLLAKYNKETLGRASE